MFFELFQFLIKNAANPLSVYGLNMRTTSSLESLNSVLGRLLCRRPNIYKFIEGIKVHEFAKVKELIQTDLLAEEDVATKRKTRKRKSDQDRDDKIKRVTEELDQNKITPDEFLEAFSKNEISLPESGRLFLSKK